MMKTNMFLNLWVWFYYKCRFIWECLCQILPISRTKIVASNILGKDYGDNPGFIYDEIRKQGLAYDLVWLQKDMNSNVPKGIRKVRYGSWRSIFELSTAKIIINNVKSGPVWKKKKGQYYIQTWHGAFPLKYIEKEAEDHLSPHYVQLSKEDSKRTDLMLSGCKLMTNVMRSSFWYSGDILECGSPRNDIFFKEGSWYDKSLKQQLGIQREKKIVLYAPTFRDDGNMSAFSLDIEKLVSILEQKTGDKWCCIVRLHPNISQCSDLFSYNNNIINGSFFPDPQLLLLASEILITDYSSIMMDFAIMRKSVFLYTPDLNYYRYEGRGLRPIINFLPFKLCQTNEELMDVVISFDKIDYLKQLESFINDVYGCFDDGHACERVVERIKNVIGF